jgi:hypothetical protein
MMSRYNCVCLLGTFVALFFQRNRVGLCNSHFGSLLSKRSCWLIDICLIESIPFIFGFKQILKQADQITFRQKRWRITNFKTAQGMLTWDHFRLRKRLLLAKQHKYPRCNVLTRNTCGGCGCVKANLRAKKVFRCQRKRLWRSFANATSTGHGTSCFAT